MINFYRFQKLTVFTFVFFAFLLFTSQQSFSQTALQFEGSNDYVTFGTATSTLGAQSFTIECWFKRTGTGVPNTTGSGGILTMVPLVTKGAPESDGGTMDANYILGIQNGTSSYIAGDFEHIASSNNNHPIVGTTPIQLNVWYHAALTFDNISKKYSLFLNGHLENEQTLGSVVPRYDSQQHAAIGTMLTTAVIETPLGFFQGVIDEVRIWNVAHTQTEIQEAMNQPITSGTGLLGRWGLNDGSGTTATNSVASSPNGTLTNGPTWVTGITFPPELWALQFDGTNDYVTFGQATSTLGAQSFTLECWFMRTGTGVVTTTGANDATGGVHAIPLVTKGRGEEDNSVVDANYFLGINTPTTGYPFANNVLVADFEEGTGTTNPGRNHPVGGTTPIVNNVWYHAAVTYDAPNLRWRLYLNGALEKDTVIAAGTRFPQYLSTQHAGLGTAMNSSGVPEGAFAGIIDEARIWNVARTQQEIQDNINLELTSGTGLLGRWALDEGTGTTAANSIAGSPAGTLTNGPLWSFGAPFNLTFPIPTAPTGLSATAISYRQISLSWTDNSDNETNFYIERSTDGGTSYSLLTTVTSNVTTYDDFSVAPSTEYYYKVYAYNSYGNSSEIISNATTPAEGDFALQFNGTNQYVTFGQNYGTSSFTIEGWFRWSGGGTANTTGTGGINLYPIITKGSPEDDGSNVDANYILGIQQTTNLIAGDFEDTNTGLNHPITGITTLIPGQWYHGAITFNNITKEYALYLNGNLEKIETLGSTITPRFDSQQHAALATMIRSNGTTTNGYFGGIIDEVRIWNYARTQTEIQTAMNQEIISETGLLGRWGLNEGTGSIAYNSIYTSTNGTLVNDPTWVTPGSPFAVTSSGTASFQEGVNGYAGTLDTYLEASNPAKINGSEDHVHWDGSPEEWALIKFDNIFGSGANQIPVGSTISSATLTYVIDDVGNNADVNEVLSDWNESTTYNTFGSTAGIQTEDYGTLVGTTSGSDAAGTKTIDVTASISNWSSNTTLNKGWIFRYTGNSGVQFRSSEYATTDQRPVLQVTYLTTVASPPDAPTNLVAASTLGNQIQLSWTDNSNTESGFRIERSTNGSGGPFTLVATVGTNVQTYLDINLSSATEYCYRVFAYNSLGNSATSTNTACATTPTNPNNAIDFGGTNAYVQVDNNAALQLSQFTIETWFRRDGTGTTTTTGTDGIPNAVPLIAKGCQQAESPANVNLNYFLGIDDDSDVLCGDFEEPTGPNHPVRGTTVIQNNVWYHATFTFDGTQLRLYLNGNLEGTVTPSPAVTCASENISRLGIGTSIQTTGGTYGYFNGVIDEVRIWNYARTQTEIQTNINDQLSSPVSGLVARWGLNEGAGTTVASSAGIALDGTITGSNYQWTIGAPFNLAFPPVPPQLVAPLNGVTVDEFPTLTATVSDNNSTNLTVKFYGRMIQPSDIFRIIKLPDTQYYSSTYPGIFTSQTQWIVDNKTSQNIVYVSHMGDIVDDGSVLSQWANATTNAMYLLDGQVPYGVAVGNHDIIGGTTNFENNFGVSHFNSYDYYGEPYSISSNMSHYDLITAGGMDFIIIYLEYNPSTAVLGWADDLLTTYSTRRAIVVSHDILLAGGTLSTAGTIIVNALRGNQNLFMMLCGHAPGENYLLQTGTNGNDIHILLADYQSRTNGGDGWLRILEFNKPSNQINIKTFSPYQTPRYETDASSQFTLNYDMGGLQTSFTELSSVSVVNGSNATFLWNNLEGGKTYEWYVTVEDQDQNITTGPIWSFSTNAALPVELASFSANVKGSEVNLNWRTETEVNNYGFEIERQAHTSTPLSVVEWNKVGFVEGNGNSNSPKSYSFTDKNLVGGSKFSYRLKQIDSDGQYEYSNIIEVALLPYEYVLYQNYPNPFNPTTNIKFSVPEKSRVSIKLFNMIGEEIKEIVNQDYEAGNYKVELNASNIVSGVYIYRLQSNNFTSVKKLIVLK